MGDVRSLRARGGGLALVAGLLAIWSRVSIVLSEIAGP
jgi:hypothetical protein